MAGSLLAACPPANAWGNGSSSSVEFRNFGIHDITCDIALRSASLTDEDLLTWLNDWYERNATDYGYSFDPSSTRPTATDNVNAYTDDPDSYWQDWDNHTLYLHPRSGWDPPGGDAATRVDHLYNQTRNHIYGWLMNGSVRYDDDQHRAAYYAGLMSHYVMDITQFGHTDWTRLDHSHPLDDPANATYHSYYESLTWTNLALRTAHVDLMMRQLPEVHRVSDPAQVVRDLAAFVNGRHGPDVQFQDVDLNTVTLGSTYVRMLELFITDYDARNTYKGARGYSEELWDLTLENLFAGMDNLTSLWTSAFLDARDMFRVDAADVLVDSIVLEPASGAYAGLEVNVTARVRNAGPVATGDLNVALLVDNGSYSEARIDLEAGETEAVDFVWTAVGGVHEIRVIADIYQQVPEGNETNNVGWRLYSVEDAHHASALAAETTSLTLLQDSSGRFNLTLTNGGNKPDVYRVYLDTYPGAIDFSLTLNVDERVPLVPGEGVLFHIDVTTLLDNPVGPRYFRVVAEGANSTSELVLAVIIEERNVPPSIEVEYDFYGNVSVPMTFDASRTWDRNGDVVELTWLMEGVAVGTGPVLVWTFDGEGDYVLELVASDGVNERRETLEVSILDAIPPRPTLSVEDWDRDAVALRWDAWDTPNATKYFSEYRFYASRNETDALRIIEEGTVVDSIDLVYVNGTVIVMPYLYWYSAEVHVVLVTRNMFGLSVMSNVVSYAPDIRHGYRWNWDETMDVIITPLHSHWIHVYNVTKYSFEVEWREWLPIGDGGYYVLRLHRDLSPHPALMLLHEETIIDLTDTHRSFANLTPGHSLEVTVRYYSSDEERYWDVHRYLQLVPNIPPQIRTAPIIDAVVGEEFSFHIIASDPDGELTRMTIDWGDGTFPLERDGGNLSIDWTYKAEGTYNVRVEVWDDDGNSTVVTAQVKVGPAEEEGPSGPWDSVTAIALIIFVALLGVIAGHLSGYYRIGREGGRVGKVEALEKEPEPKASPGKEPEPTAEEIVSELEEDLGDGKDKEYFDHEPSVAELEEMIPRDPE